MWLRLSNGREELVVNEDHINRLLNEGAVEIPDPRSMENKPLSPDVDSSDEEVTQQLPAQKAPKRISKSK